MAPSSAADSKVPSNFLAGPAPTTMKATPIDFKETPLPEYTGAYATLISDALSSDECRTLLSLAEKTGSWEAAMVNVGGGEQMLLTQSRNCGRIIWDTTILADRLLSRIKGFLDPITTLQNQPCITGNGPVKRKEVWRMTRLNERLRFLKYQKGCYFREHCDGTYVTPNGQEYSFFTLHLYLNEADDNNKLRGGATRFHSDLFPGKHYDVAPRTGSVLVFQHRGLVHSGDELEGGTKYTVRTDIMYRRVKGGNGVLGWNFDD